MEYRAKILAFAGSTRAGSFNKKLVLIAASGAREMEASVTYIDLREFSMPLYDADMEIAAGLPENAQKLKDLIISHQGLMISAPEYNSSISGVLKNTIDWVSRPLPGQSSVSCFEGKTAVLMSASPGALGGLRGLVHVRAILGNMGVLVLPQQVAVPAAHEAFNEQGGLKVAEKQRSVEKLGADLAQMLIKLHREVIPS